MQHADDGDTTPDPDTAPEAGGVEPFPEPSPEPAPRRRRRWPRRLGFTLIGVLVLLLVAVGGASGYVAWAVHRSFPDVNGTLRVSGLHHPAQVYRDGYGVPQIYADDAHDLFLAQGYTHAQDRFWQMDADRHITAGTLSEMFGASQVDTDKVVRTLGWRRVARQELRLLTPTSRAYLQAYSDGVNAYLHDHHGTQISIEYTVLGFINSGYKPAAWTPTDSVSWLKAMAWSLIANLDEEVQRGLLSASLSTDQIAQLYPSYDYSYQQPIVAPDPRAHAAGGGAGGGGGLPPVRAAAALAPVTSVFSTLDGVLGPHGSGIGSNSWVVAGSRTVTGKPLLANDPHLAPQQPGIWYQVGLHCTTVRPSCPFDVSGFSFAGMPGVIIGHNADIAWGFTNFGGDVSDLFLEKVDGDHYEYKGRQLPLQQRRETIRVAGGSPVNFTARATRHGPLLSDLFGADKRLGVKAKGPGIPAGHAPYAVALDWTALHPSNTMDALFELDRAHDWTSFRAAAADFGVPSQNLVYADRAGNIGYQAPGRIPVRRSGDGTYPQPGWTGAGDWTGYLPFADLPHEYNPPQGFIVTANNAAVGPDYPHLLTRDWSYGYRSDRISSLISSAGKLDAAAMQRIQSDTYNGNAATLVPHLLAVPTHGRTAEAQRLLHGWDFHQPTSSAPAAYFNAVWKNLLRLMFTARLSRTPAYAYPDGGDRWFEVVRHLLDEPTSQWWSNPSDHRHISGQRQMLTAAMDDAAKELSGTLGPDPKKWTWGALHQLTLTNQTLGSAGPAPVQWLLNQDPSPMGGGSAIVDANGWNAAVDYQVDWAPSMRLVTDVSNWDSSRWVNQTGASGHAFDDNYADQTPLWRTGRTTAWPFSSTAVHHAARHHLVLRPTG